MGLASWFVGLGSTAAGYILPFLFVLTIVVFFHELGHFLVARWCGVSVRTFSVGFGPELVGFTDRKGTRWRLSLIPLGGYVKFLGDDNVASVPDPAAVSIMAPADQARAFVAKSVGARAAIVTAGPIANFILALVIFTGIFAVFGEEYVVPQVDSIVAGSAAELAGFKVGDEILTVDGKAIESFDGLRRIVAVNAGRTLSIDVRRDGKLLNIPVLIALKDGMGQLGVGRSAKPDEVLHRSYSVPAAIVAAANQEWFIVSATAGTLGKMLTGQQSGESLGGMKSVASASAQVAALGFLPLLGFAAVISVSIGLLNLVPIPLLDGGHLLFYLIEAIRGRPLSDGMQEFGLRVGFVLVLGLVIYANGNDFRIWHQLGALVGG